MYGGQDESGNATGIQPYDDPMMIINLSVWKDVDALRQFTFRTEHARFMRLRRQWFEKLSEVVLVMWWVPAGELPSAQEGKNRLERLRSQGETEAAFSFRQTFNPPTGE